MHKHGISNYFDKTETMFNLMKGFLVGLTFHQSGILKGMSREGVGFGVFFTGNLRLTLFRGAPACS